MTKSIVNFNVTPKNEKVRYRTIDIILSYNPETYEWEWKFSRQHIQEFRGHKGEKWRALKEAKTIVDSVVDW